MTIEPDEKQWDPGVQGPNEHIRARIHAVMCGQVGGYSTHKTDQEPISRTELDSHANMPVVGRHVLLIEDLGKSVDVTPFSPDYSPLQAKLIDCAVQYDCPYNGRTYMLLIRNAIYVPSMTNNLIPPFIMREAGVVVNDIPKTIGKTQAQKTML